MGRMVGKKKSPFVAKLARLAKAIAKAKPKKLHALLFEAFEVFAMAGDVGRAEVVLGWMYGARLPAPTDVATALSTQAMDGFCLAAGLGDRTGGEPRTSFARGKAPSGALAERVAAGEVEVCGRILRDAYARPPATDAWAELPEGDPWRTNDRWRRIQALAGEGRRREALDRLVPLVDTWDPEARGAGYGDELVLALDLALELGEAARIPAWIARQGERFVDEAFLVQTALGLPRVARFIAEGGLRDVVRLDEAEREAALRAIDEALDAATSAAPKPAPKVQKRRVSAEYSQVHLGPETLTGEERALVHFQRPDDHALGMSLFPTMVGIGTPSDTDYVDAEVTLSDGDVVALEGVVRAVAFPLVVRGPLLLSSVSGGEDEVLEIPPGTYDVAARFVPKKAPKASASAGLRVFGLLLTFHPAGALGAPRVLVREADA